jgi:hypothetical protein
MQKIFEINICYNYLNYFLVDSYGKNHVLCNILTTITLNLGGDDEDLRFAYERIKACHPGCPVA